jgi:hypothetical protein
MLWSGPLSLEHQGRPRKASLTAEDTVLELLCTAAYFDNLVQPLILGDFEVILLRNCGGDEASGMSVRIPTWIWGNL